MNQRSYQAAVFTSVGEALQLNDYALAPLRPGEVRVRISCCTICGSDLHTFAGHRSGPAPSILGHEVVGLVDEVAGEVRDIDANEVQVGQRVTWSIAASCGACDRCKRELPQKCRELFKYGHEPLDSGRPDGGLAEFCVLRPGTAIIPLPAEVSDEVLCPAICATATVMAAVRKCGTLKDKRVLVLGAGMLGLTTVAVSRASGATSICVVDPLEARRELTLSFGADRFVPQLEVTPDAQQADTFDAVFEMSGHVNAVEAALRHAAIGANVAFVGTVSPTPDVAVNPEQLVRRCISIHGVHNYHPLDLASAVRFLSERHAEFPFASLVENRFELSSVNDAFQEALEHRPIRVAVRPAR